MSMLVLPRVQAMILCDELEESDQDFDAVDLAGVRAVIGSPVFPVVRPQLCVFIQMSGHQGDANCHIEIEALAMGEVIHESDPLTFAFEDPTVVVPVHFRLSNCMFPAPGVYYVQIYCENKLIGERPLVLQKER